MPLRALRSVDALGFAARLRSAACLESTLVTIGLPGSPAIQRGRFERFRSATRSYCHLAVTFSERRLCDMDLPWVEQLLGVPLVRRPRGPHLPGWGIGFDIKAPDGGVTEVDFGSSAVKCSQIFSIHTEGAWE